MSYSGRRRTRWSPGNSWIPQWRKKRRRRPVVDVFVVGGFVAALLGLDEVQKSLTVVVGIGGTVVHELVAVLDGVVVVV